MRVTWQKSPGLGVANTGQVRDGPYPSNHIHTYNQLSSCSVKKVRLFITLYPFCIHECMCTYVILLNGISETVSAVASAVEDDRRIKLYLDVTTYLAG